MPRADEPTISVRLSREDHAVISTAAEAVGVSVGALVRECVRRSAAGVARDVSEGRLILRRRSGSGSGNPVPAPAAPDPVDHAPEVAEALGVSRSEARRRIAQAGPIRLDTVSDAQKWAMERQERLNKDKGV